MLRRKGKGIVLCGRKKCCPILSILKDGRIEIVDDDGNSVKMEKDQALLITEAVKELDRQKRF